MSNFGLPEYDQHREWIRNARNRNMKWEEIGEELGMDRRTASRKFLNYFQKT